MRVTHVITRLIVGGAQENTVSTVLGLHGRRDVQVDLLSGPTTGPEGTLESEFRTTPELLKIVPNLVRQVDPFKDANALRQLTRIFAASKPDIVHTHSGKAGILGRLAANRAGVPVIIHTIHGPSFGTFQGAIPNVIFRSAERYAARSTTHFVSVANAMSAQYLAAGIGTPEQYTRIFSGFDIQPYLNSTNDLMLRRKLGLSPEDIVLGKIARLFELKGHDELFSIAADLVKHCPRLKFLLVGDGPLRVKLTERAHNLGLANSFFFTGLVRPQEVAQYVGVMDMLVHLSRREGLPRALPQALAAGKPIVSFNCDGAPEVCREGETGFLIRPGDLQTLMKRLLQLAGDPALRAKLGGAGQNFVREHFPVERMVNDINDLYVKLLRKVGRR